MRADGLEIRVGDDAHVKIVSCAWRVVNETFCLTVCVDRSKVLNVCYELVVYGYLDFGRVYCGELSVVREGAVGREV